MGFVSLLRSRVGGYIAAGLAVLALLFGVYRSGKKSAQVDGMENQLNNVKVRNDVEQDVATSDPASKRERLQQWTRD